MSNPGILTVGSHGAVVLASQTGDTGTGYGPFMVEAKGFTKWVFSLAGTFTNFSVTIYGTYDTAAKDPVSLLASSTYAVPQTGGNWFILPAPAEQGGAETGVYANPLTNSSTSNNPQSLYYQGPLVAVGLFIQGATSTGTVKVLGFAAP